MKKLIYIIIVAAFASVTITSCTEQEVKPSSNSGVPSDPKN